MALKISDIDGLTPEEMVNRFSYQELAELRRSLEGPASPTTQIDPPVESAEGITPYDPEQDFFSSQNLSAMGSNILPSAANVGSDFWNMVTSPVESAKAIGEAGVGGIMSALGERFGGLENIKRTAVEDPFGLALDVSPGLGAASKLTKASALGSKIVNPVATIASPVKAASRITGALGKGAAGLAKAAASAASGIDPGILSTARKIRGATPKSVQRTLEAADPIGWPENVNPAEFVKKQREGFDAGFKGQGDSKLISGIEDVSDSIKSQLDDIAAKGIAEFSDKAIDETAYFQALQGVREGLQTHGVALTGRWKIVKYEGKRIRVPDMDFKGSTIPDDTSAQTRIAVAFKYLVEPFGDQAQSQLRMQIPDVWMARKRIDEMARNALKQQYGDTESTILKQMRGDLNKFMHTVPDEAFQKFDADYAAMSSIRETFDQMVAGKIDKDNQISAMIRSIKEGRQLSEAFITRVEATTGVPLRAIAAGKELSGILPRGLIGRSIFAALAGTAVGVDAIVGLLIAPPKLIGLYLKGIGLGERAIRRVGEAVEQVMSLPKARALAEEGMTLGLILQQLERENEQPSVMARMGQAQSGQAEPPPSPSLGASETSVPEETFGLPHLQQYQPIIERHSQFNQIPPEFIEAVIQAESGGDPNAESRAGAVGLMQLMPVHKVGDRRDPEQNIAAGAAYLKELIDEFGSMERALWAYNAGPTAARAGRMPKETKEYIPKVMAIYSRLGGLN